MNLRGWSFSSELSEKPDIKIDPIGSDITDKGDALQDAMDALLDSGLWENRQYKVFYITLSDILREYLWRQFGVDASADTSAELLRRVKNMTQMAPFMYQLRDFLSSGDLVKFAKAVPSEQVRDKDVKILREIIIETAPKELSPAAREDEA